MNNAGMLNYWIKAAMIGAIYAVLTISLAPISYGVIQVRVAEALTVLPYFSPAAIPGLFVGCVIANIFGGNGLLD
ncbi:MAG TPA: QueT transporter family protein, partial [Bacillota bacterium]|nr:QueT transporter family protein [Bacillota bacterium]